MTAVETDPPTLEDRPDGTRGGPMPTGRTGSGIDPDADFADLRGYGEDAGRVQQGEPGPEGPAAAGQGQTGPR